MKLQHVYRDGLSFPRRARPQIAVDLLFAHIADLPVNLVAAEVYFHPNDDNHCATVGFRAADDSYFLLSRALSPTQQDCRLGHDAVHIELSDQGLSCYGGIGAASVFPALIRFELNERGEEATHQSVVEIRHDLPRERAWQLRQVLALVFDGFPRYTDCA